LLLSTPAIGKSQNIRILGHITLLVYAYSKGVMYALVKNVNATLI